MIRFATVVSVLCSLLLCCGYSFGQVCDVVVGTSCFRARIYRNGGLNYSEAVADCESHGSEIAVIKGEDVQKELKDILAMEMPVEIYDLRLWVGMKIDSHGNLSPEGSYAKWHPSFPLTPYGRFHNLYLLILQDAKSRYQGMINANPGRILHGVICEKNLTQSGPCDKYSTTGVTYWLESISEMTVTRDEAEMMLCGGRGGTLAYPLSTEHFTCFEEMRKDKEGYRSYWLGIYKNEDNYTVAGGVPAPYVDDWYLDEPGVKGVYMRSYDHEGPEMRLATKEDKLYGAVCQKQTMTGADG